MPDIIHTDQTGYVKGRYIGCNIRNIIDIYDYTEESNAPGALLSIDFEKAFDMLEHNFMFKALEKFNFGSNFVQWIRIFYENPVFRMKNNGWVSGTYKMLRGVRQGCPMSALLFIISLEFLSTDIRNDRQIRGIRYGGYEHKICQYADDATIFVSELDSIKHVIKCIDNFSKNAGLKLNLKKTKGIWLGNFKNLGLRVKDNIIWTGNPVKCLGVYIGHNSEKCYNKNWIRKFEGIEKLLTLWSKRNLSLFGKITVIKTYALSKIVFPATMLPTNKEIIKKLASLFHRFLWGKRDRIKRESLTNTIQCGGLNMPDIEKKNCSLRAGCVQRMCMLKGKWKAGINSIAAKCNVTIDYLIKMNFIDRSNFKILQHCSKFYVDILIAYNKCKGIMPFEKMSVFEILNQPLWGNRLLMCDNKCIIFKEWIKSDLLYVKDLVNKNGILMRDTEIEKKIKQKINIFQQLYIYMNFIYKKLKGYVLSIAPYTKIRKTIELHYDGKLYSVRDQRSNLFYKILNDNPQRCKMESIHSRENLVSKIRNAFGKLYILKKLKISVLSNYENLILNYCKTLCHVENR